MTINVFASFHDLKQKRSNGGGLSDGNLVCVRRTLTTQKSVIVPPAGKAWQLTPLNNSSDSLWIFNFDSVVDATVLASLTQHNGTEFAAPPIPVPAQTPSGALGLFGELGIVLTPDTPFKAWLQAPVPTGRVLFAALFTEFDLPKDG